MRTQAAHNGPEEVYVELSLTPTAPNEARRELDHLAGNVPPGRLEDARLLVSEIVTNVLRHAAFPPGAERRVKVSAVVEGARLECSVCDTGTGFEPPQDPRPKRDLSGGWGLYVLNKLSDRWGTRQEGRLFCVWFEVSW